LDRIREVLGSSFDWDIGYYGSFVKSPTEKEMSVFNFDDYQAVDLGALLFLLLYEPGCGRDWLRVDGWDSIIIIF
jgi:hypothetical protein